MGNIGKEYHSNWTQNGLPVFQIWNGVPLLSTALILCSYYTELKMMLPFYTV